MDHTSANAFEAQFDHILKRAFESGASDVHIEPQEERIVVRIRIDGLLTELLAIDDARFRGRFLEQAKKLGGFDLGKAGIPQDSRFRHDTLPLDFRASLCPVLHGEKLVVRLLERGRKFALRDLPLPSEAKDGLRRALMEGEGLVIVSGPTGSGKTTLLYSALHELDWSKRNIHTIEDPIEYTFDGLNQTQVSASVSFADALRSLMRQDPDVILIGEIRDTRTAEAAVHAAMTGHLVLATVHANSAPEIVPRLVALGCSRDDLESVLIFASAQRLVPRNCPNCLADERDTAIVRLLGTGVQPKRSQGCGECKNTGVRGRVLLFEHLARSADPDGGTGLARRGSLGGDAARFLKEGLVSAQHALAYI